ncbi:MAG: sulfurtransferase TusA family protein [Methylocystaceae bacterium]
MVDARGLSCPLPVLRTKKAVEQGSEKIIVLVDREVARENVEKFARQQGYQVTITADNQGWKLELNK